MKKILIIGSGSIGQRHFRLLQEREFGPTQFAFFTTVKSKLTFSPGPDVLFFRDWSAVESFAPHATIICNPSALHPESLIELLKLSGDILVEKPLATRLEQFDTLQPLLETSAKKVNVALQMRFHPAITAVREQIAAGDLGKIFQISAHIGSCLSDWHPWENFRESYAAKKDLGGGVIMTLIHELDTLFWLTGVPASIAFIGGRHTPLQIESEDTAAFLWTTPRDSASVSLTMNYWESPPTRTLRISAESGLFEWDFQAGTLRETRRHGETKILNFSTDRDELHRACLRDFFSNVRPSQNDWRTHWKCGKFAAAAHEALMRETVPLQIMDLL